MPVDVVTVTIQTNVTNVVGVGSQGPAGSTTGTALVGDTTGTLVTNVNEKINGVTVPVGTGNAVGNVLRVTTAGAGGAMAYGALDLADSDAATGVSPATRGGTGLSAYGTAWQTLGMNAGATALVYTTIGGDVTAASGPGSLKVVALTGASGSVPIAATGNVFTWAQATTAPGLAHAQQADASAPATLSVTPQAPGASATNATNGTPGSLHVDLAAIVNGGTEAGLRVRRAGTPVASLQGLVGTPSLGALYLGNLTPTASNWALMSDSVGAAVNALTSVSLRISNTNILQADASNVHLYVPTVSWLETVAAPTLKQAARTTNATPQALTIRAQDAWVSATPAETKVGGALNLSSGLSYIGESNTDYGPVNFQTGGTTGLTYVTDYLYWASDRSPMFFQAQAAGAIAGKHTLIQAQSGGATSGAGGNLVFDAGLGTGGGANGTHWFRTGTTNRLNVDENGLRFTQDVGDISTAMVIDQTTRTGTGTNNGYHFDIAAQAGQLQTGGAANNNGGNLRLAAGAAGTGGGGAAGLAGNVTLTGTALALTGSLRVGLTTKAMADAPQTLSAADSLANLIITTGANTAVRALTISAPPTSGAMKIVRNNCTVFGITVKFATGAATGTIAPGASAVVIGDGTNAVLLMVGT